MFRSPFRAEADNYTLYGVLFGLCFPLLASLTASLTSTGTVSLAAILEAQRTNPLLWIIDTAPFFLGLCARRAGRRQDMLHRQVQDRDAIIEARTAELREALEEAHTAARAKATFLGTMSHEIRTPLNGVLGMVQVLDHTPLSPDQRECVEVIRSSSETLLTVLTDVLDFAAIEAGDTETPDTSHQPFDLHALLEESVSSTVRPAAERGLPINLLIHPDTPAQVLGDPARLRKVLIHLLYNAVKFTHEGEVFVEVTAERHTDTATVAIAVQDTGIGIDPEQIPHLFQPFRQVDPSMNRRYGGTGLGLALSQRLSRQMGGGITVESTPGRGSTFTLTIPLGVTPQPREALPPLGEGRTLLVVGRCAGLRHVLSHLGERWGFDVLPATTVEAALAVLMQRYVPDAILLAENLSDAALQRLADALEQAPALAAPPLLHLTTPLTTPCPSLQALPSYHPLPAPLTPHALHRILHASWQEAAPADADTKRDEPAPCTEPPTFDRTLFERFRDVEAEGDLAFVHSLLHQFLDEAQEMLSEMRRAFQDGDLDTVRFLAHKLTSSSRLFGACRLSSLCREAELGTPTPALLDRMWAEFEAAAACLREACAPGADDAPPTRRTPSRQRA